MPNASKEIVLNVLSIPNIYKWDEINIGLVKSNATFFKHLIFFSERKDESCFCSVTEQFKLHVLITLLKYHQHNKLNILKV